MPKDIKTLTIPSSMLTEKHQGALRAQLAKVGFTMAAVDQPGWATNIEGVHSIPTGLASEPRVVVDYNNGHVTFTSEKPL